MPINFLNYRAVKILIQDIRPKHGSYDNRNIQSSFGLNMMINSDEMTKKKNKCDATFFVFKMTPKSCLYL